MNTRCTFGLWITELFAKIAATDGSATNLGRWTSDPWPMNCPQVIETISPAAIARWAKTTVDTISTLGQHFHT